MALRRTDRLGDGPRRGAVPATLVAAVAATFAVAVLAAAGCAAAGAGPGPDATSPSTSPPPGSVGTIAHLSAPPPSTMTVSQPPTTIVTTPTQATSVGPPPTTSEPRAATGTCPYLTILQVEDANGQRAGATSVIATKPYPVCVFTRSSGGFLAAARIVVAATAAGAVAAVNEHVPIDASFPVTHPAGWTGGAMATPNGLPGYPDAGSIYAVSKGTIAIIAISNQKQSIKGRQMVADIVANLGL